MRVNQNLKILSIILFCNFFCRKQNKQQLKGWFTKLKSKVIKLHNDRESGKYWNAVTAAASGVAGTASMLFLAKNPVGAGATAIGALGSIGYILYPSNTPPVAILSLEQIRDKIKNTEKQK